jgi:glycosyltransferase involved in cell wall biosynthesis
VSVDEQVLPLGGDIVPQDDIQRLEEAIRVWLANRASLRAMRVGARQQAVERFDIRLLSDRLRAAYAEVTN